MATATWSFILISAAINTVLELPVYAPSAVLEASRTRARWLKRLQLPSLQLSWVDYGRLGTGVWQNMTGWIDALVFIPRRGYKYSKAFRRLWRGYMLYVGQTWLTLWARWKVHIKNALAMDGKSIYRMMRLKNVYHWVLVSLKRILAPGSS